MPVRIMSAEVKYILTESDASGRPIGERVTQSIRVFRAVHDNIWTHGEHEAFAADAPKDEFGYAIGELAPSVARGV